MASSHGRSAAFDGYGRGRTHHCLCELRQPPARASSKAAGGDRHSAGLGSVALAPDAAVADGKRRLVGDRRCCWSSHRALGKPSAALGAFVPRRSSTTGFVMGCETRRVRGEHHFGVRSALWVGACDWRYRHFALFCYAQQRGHRKAQKSAYEFSPCCPDPSGDQRRRVTADWSCCYRCICSELHFAARGSIGAAVIHPQEDGSSVA